MLLHRVLDRKDKEDIFLAEESIGDLITLPVTTELVSSDIQADRAIELGGGLGVAFHLTNPAEFWLVLTDRYSENKILEGLKKQQEKLTWERAITTESEFFEAIIEYFSTSLTSELFCELCDVQGGPLYVEERIRRLESFLRPRIQPKTSILEICCGSGMATQSLLRLGARPLSIELDRCEMCQGLKAGKLEPNRSFVLDARLLNFFYKPESFDVVVGFMVGLIDQINWSKWKEILLTASSLAKNMVLYTVYTKKEAELIAKTLHEAGWFASLIDNHDASGIYDQWVVQAKRSS